MKTFEDKLLTELQAVVAETRPARGRRRVLIGLAACVTLAAGTAVAVPLIGGEKTTSPAYSVTVESTGEVSIKILRFEDAEALERDLKAAGVSADVHYLPVGRTCQRTPAGVRITGEDLRLPPAKNGKIQMVALATFEEHDGHYLMKADPAVLKGGTLTIETTSPNPVTPKPGMKVELLRNATFGPCVVVDDQSEPARPVK